MRSAFTVFEVILVVVILALLVAMAVPAVRRMKQDRHQFDQISERILQHAPISPQDHQWYHEYAHRFNLREATPTLAEIPETLVRIEGKTYRVTPCDPTGAPTEFTLKGQTYKLTPQ